MRRIILAIAFTVAITALPTFVAAGNDGQVATDPEQVIKCRKVEVTGSMIKKGKVCRTIAEWKKIMDNGNRVARAVVDEGAKPTN